MTDENGERFSKWADLWFISEEAQNNSIPIRQKDLHGFTHIQFRSVILEFWVKIPIIRSTPKQKWNFEKAQSVHQSDPPMHIIHNRFIKSIIATPTMCIPRSFRKEYIPRLTDDIKELYVKFQDSREAEMAEELLKYLNIERHKKWEEIKDALHFEISTRESFEFSEKTEQLIHLPATLQKWQQIRLPIRWRFQWPQGTNRRKWILKNG